MKFSELLEVPLREVWGHEANEFTPWLVANMNRLSQAIGIPIEPDATEVAVEQFSADVVAHNQSDGSRILIENQLEGSDHKHLGQVLTYLAGVRAQTVIWIAREFDEPHRSAIRWLNDHTTEPFAFFAVRIRVVRIENSPIVPIFEVLEQPSSWERDIREKAEAESELTRFRREFWAFCVQAHPGGFFPSNGYAASSFWIWIGSAGLNLAPYISQGGVGVWLRGKRGEDADSVKDRISRYGTQLKDELGVEVGEGTGWGSFAGSDYLIDANGRDNWATMADWLAETIEKYTGILESTRPHLPIVKK